MDTVSLITGKVFHASCYYVSPNGSGMEPAPAVIGEKIGHQSVYCDNSVLK